MKNLFFVSTLVLSVSFLNANNNPKTNPNPTTDEIKVSHVKVSQVSAVEKADGKITIEVYGGQAPYTYYLSNGYQITSNEKSITFTNLSADTYNYHVIDAFGKEIHDDKERIEIKTK